MDNNNDTDARTILVVDVWVDGNGIVHVEERPASRDEIAEMLRAAIGDAA